MMGRRGWILGGMAALALSCGPPPHAVGLWYPSEPCVSTRDVTCSAPRQAAGSPGESQPVPAPGELGPRLLVRDPVQSLAVSGDLLAYIPFGPGRRQEICMLRPAGGPVSCFPSVDPGALVDLHAGGPWLYGMYWTMEGQQIARLHRERHAVELLPLFAKGERPGTVSFGAPDDICMVVERWRQDAPERSLARVPRAGGPRTTLVAFGQVRVDAVACDATDAYFIGASGLARVPLRGGPAVVLGTSAYRVALGPRAVYVAGPRGIEKLPKGSTQLALVAPVRPRYERDEPILQVRALAGGVTWQEWRDHNPWFAIRWCLDDRGCETLAESETGLNLVGVEDGVAYWTGPGGLHATRGPARLNVAGDGRSGGPP
jgi:hypothetical protein